MLRENLFLVLGLALVTLIPFQGQAQDDIRGIVIGTGGKAGVYYPTGVAICNAVKNEMNNTIPCVAEPSGGSVDNIDRMRTGKANFAIVQADTLFYAANGYGHFKETGAFPRFRTVLSLYTEVFTILARKDAGIKTFDDLKGKRVNIGNPGSGQHISMELLMKYKGWTNKDFAKAYELTSSQISGALCDNKVDAIAYVIAHPNESMKRAASECETVLVDVMGPAVTKMVEKFPYLERTTIRGGTYPGSNENTRTFGIKANLVSTLDTSPALVFDLVRSLSYDHTDFLFSHPAFKSLSRQNLWPSDEIVPVHFGSAKFYKYK